MLRQGNKRRGSVGHTCEDGDLDENDIEEKDVYEELVSSLRPRKRRKGVAVTHSSDVPMDCRAGSGSPEAVAGDVEDIDGLADGESDDSKDNASLDSEVESECDAGERLPGKDPFCEHIEENLSEDEVSTLEKIANKPLTFTHNQCPILGSVSSSVVLPGKNTAVLEHPCSSLSQLHIKERLCKRWAVVNEESSPTHSGPFTELQYKLFSIINGYKDLLYTCRTFENGEEIRRIYLLHALNHVLKTRSRVRKNNSKLSLASKEGKETSTDEFQDQGLTRPKVLIVLPMKEAALRTVKLIMKLLISPGQGQVSNKKRFISEFSEKKHAPSGIQKPVSFQRMFAGNIDDCFRLGIAVKGSTISLYSNFYNSDIIVASPLGLRTIIGVEGEREHDYDFLSSIELLIVDQADVYLMQNWDHILHILRHLNLQPKDSHGVDFSRVRMWSINGWSKYYRQTLVIADYPTPEINSVFNKNCFNYSGKLRVSNSHLEGTICQVASPVSQVFHRFTCKSFSQLSEMRFTYFTEEILPEHKGPLMEGTLIFIPSYFDFVRVRNYMRKEEMSFAQLCEYTKKSDISRARSNFFHGKRHFLLYTERVHFFRRFWIRGCKHVVFYAFPNYAEFYSDVMNFLEQGSATCTVIYSKYDALSLSRIVGSRAEKMLIAENAVQTLVTGTL